MKSPRGAGVAGALGPGVSSAFRVAAAAIFAIVSGSSVAAAPDDPALLVQAARRGDLEKVRELVEGGADVNAAEPEEEDRPLAAAASGGHHRVVEYLLSRGARVDEGALDFRMTALMIATHREDLALARILLAHGANPNAQDVSSRTPILFAVWGNSVPLLRLLLAAKADPNVRYGPAPAIVIATDMHGDVQVEMVGALLDAGARIDERTESGRTALHSAALHGRTAVVKLLLARGAAKDLRDNDGRTPLDWAREKGQVEAVRLLSPSRGLRCLFVPFLGAK